MMTTEVVPSPISWSCRSASSTSTRAAGCSTSSSFRIVAPSLVMVTSCGIVKECEVVRNCALLELELELELECRVVCLQSSAGERRVHARVTALHELTTIWCHGAWAHPKNGGGQLLLKGGQCATVH